ncbi:serine-rich protein-related [Raphanus sativus]|nr:serine-rich protein-related [Raphanus sativus]
MAVTSSRTRSTGTALRSSSGFASSTTSTFSSISRNHRSIAVSKPSSGSKIPDSRRRCMCSPTTHPGSFRCALHKNVANPHGQGAAVTASYPTNSLNMRRSAMTNSLVRIGGVEGEWVRRALTTLIRPSSHQQKRRSAYQPRPSRLSAIQKDDLDLLLGFVSLNRPQEISFW